MKVLQWVKSIIVPVVLFSVVGCDSSGGGGDETIAVNLDSPVTPIGTYLSGYTAVSAQFRRPANPVNGVVEQQMDYELITDAASKTIELSIGGEPGYLPVYTYDDSGLVTKYHIPDAVTITVEYNSNGSIDSTVYDAGDTYLSVSYSYVGSRLMSKLTYSYTGQSRDEMRQLSFVYSETGELLRAEEVDVDTQAIVGVVLEYTVDDAGRIVEALEYGSDGALARRHTVSYDENGNATNVGRYFSDGSLEYSYIFSYVESENLVPNVIGFEAAIKEGFLSRWSHVFIGPDIF